MITRVSICEKDKYVLSQIDRSVDKKQNTQPLSYKDKVVIKPWGYEFLIFENEHVAIWQLHIKHQHATSMHCHPKKNTCLSVLQGNVLSNTFEKRQILESGQATVIDKAVFHSSKALSEAGCVLMELETPPDKVDLVRLNDAYGRQKEGYEGLNEMEETKLERFHYYSFDEPSCPDGQTVINSGCTIKIACYNDQTEFYDAFQLTPSTHYQLCRGSIFNNASQKSYGVGDAFSADEISHIMDLECALKTVIISIKVN